MGRRAGLEEHSSASSSSIDSIRFDWINFDSIWRWSCFLYFLLVSLEERRENRTSKNLGQTTIRTYSRGGREGSPEVSFVRTERFDLSDDVYMPSKFAEV